MLNFRVRKFLDAAARPASAARSAGKARRRQGLKPEGARRRRRLDAQHESPAPQGGCLRESGSIKSARYAGRDLCNNAY
ncbi:hypothetical protein D5039_21525 [Verminephrobacter aporrectodeae subsp. tuberculatae]|uniref:Uncharacterized protein n=1 Tax=Verminephrobacter aporrectodeae subsp. tuberculatae TaxID=1110392 RepID=A0ABT3L061_9BURK|nr:hypothetical protein [Verminephrobacter aporrectodeae subsp. tuberculatae]